MAELNVRPPNLPLATDEYDRRYQDQLNNILRLFFAQLNNPGDMGGATLNLNIAISESPLESIVLPFVDRDPENVAPNAISPFLDTLILGDVGFTP